MQAHCFLVLSAAANGCATAAASALAEEAAEMVEGDGDRQEST